MAPQTTNAPYLDSVLTYGHGGSIPQFTSAPFMDTAFAFGPSTTIGTPPTGLVVKIGATELTGSFARRFRDELVGAGTWQMALPNDDAAMPAFDDVVTFEVDGQVRFGGVVERKNATMFAPAAIDEVTALSGSGRLAVTKKSVIAPSRGWDAVPVEVTRSQSWVSFDFDDSGWAQAKRIRRADIPRPYYPNLAIPEWWPDKTAWWVAPNLPSVTGTEAPPGRSLYRSEPITLADDGVIAIFTGFNNLGTAYWDGALIADIENEPGDSNRVDVETTAGDHILSASVTNYIRDTGFIASIWTVDGDGLLDELVWSSDSLNVLSLGYPNPVPGPTAGRAIRNLLEEAQADGELLDVTLDFTDHVDSDGNAWSSVVEITTEVGRKFMEYLESLSAWLVDVQMAPGANVLRAWNWGTRGGTPGVTVTATTDRETTQVGGLSFDGLHVRANRLRIRYKKGYTVVDESGSDPIVTDFLDLSEVQTQAAAQLMGRREIERRQNPSYAGTLDLSPNSVTPYDAFDNGDTIGHPDDPAGSDSSRVRSIQLQENDEGVLDWTVELHDIRQEVEERQENWLKRVAMGTLAGGSRVTSRRGDAIESARRVAAKDCAEFSFDGPLVASSSMVRPATQTGNLIEVIVELTTAGSTSTTVRVLHNGVSLGSIVLAAGETSKELDLGGAKIYRNFDKLQAEIVTAGTGAGKLDIQVRVI